VAIACHLKNYEISMIYHKYKMTNENLRSKSKIQKIWFRRKNC